ncbi:MAG: hypothetical protein Q7R49_03425 [Candidatus Daviesbacteria bacterium]|nr:hypothetical protein [Candidatus Daviesbacteria bacterium]
MTQDDINQIDELLNKRLDEKLAASEQRLEEKLLASEQRTTKDIGNFIEENLLPQLADKADKTDIDRLERKLDRSLDTGLDHEKRLKDIEQVSVVAHELKIKKAG